MISWKWMKTTFWFSVAINQIIHFSVISYRWHLNFYTWWAKYLATKCAKSRCNRTKGVHVKKHWIWRLTWCHFWKNEFLRRARPGHCAFFTKPILLKFGIRKMHVLQYVVVKFHDDRLHQSKVMTNFHLVATFGTPCTPPKTIPKSWRPLARRI